MFVAQATRPDILYAVNFLSRFNQQPTRAAWTAAKRTMRYLGATKQYKLCYSSQDKRIAPIVYSDADWAGDTTDRRSTSGALITIGGGPVVFASRKQSVTAQSSTEAKFIAANEAAKELKWVTQLLGELRVGSERPKLLIDNAPTIKQIQNPDKKRRRKHIEVRFNSIREQYLNKLFDLHHIDSQHQAADLLTKAVSPRILRKLVTILGCCQEPW